MSASKNSPKDVQRAFDELLGGFSEEERLEQQTRLIGHAFLSEVERVMNEQGMTRKGLAEHMAVSPAFVSQLFSGDAPLSDRHKALMQRALDIVFEVRARELYAVPEEQPEFHYPEVKSATDHWVLYIKRPDYNRSDAVLQVSANEANAA